MFGPTSSNHCVFSCWVAGQWKVGHRLLGSGSTGGQCVALTGSPVVKLVTTVGSVERCGASHRWRCGIYLCTRQGIQRISCLLISLDYACGQPCLMLVLWFADNLHKSAYILEVVSGTELSTTCDFWNTTWHESL